MKLLSLFSGIGAFEKALKNANVDYDLVGFSEVDKFAIKSYCAIHGVGENLNLGDVSSIDVKLLPQNIDIVVHGSPCTSFSVAGKGKGGDKGSGTQSSLMWYSVDIIKKVKPKYVVWENVKNVISKKHIHNFNQYIEDLKEVGYTSYYKILNAKDFGLPQNRERIYVVSILDDKHTFEFPQGFPLELKLKDILEDSVEDKYYLSQEMQDRFFKFPQDRLNNECLEVLGTTTLHPCDENGNVKYRNCTSAWVYNPNKCISTLSARDYKQPKQIIEVLPVRLGGVFDEEGRRHQAGSIYDKEFISPTLDTMQGGWRQPLVIDGEVVTNFKIRRLTPLECWRLMGFSDDDFYKAKNVPTSDTQLYKQIGNSIAVPVLENIFKNLFKQG